MSHMFYGSGMFQDLASGLLHGRGHDFSNERVAMIPITGIAKPPKAKMSEVVFEEVDGELETNVKTKPMKEVPRPVRILFRTKRLSKHFYAAELREDGNYVMAFTSEANFKDIGNSYEAWLPIHANGVKIIETLQVCLNTTWSKTYSITQRFLIEKTKFSGTPTIQMYCNAKIIRFEGEDFQEGDIVTFSLYNNSDDDKIAGMISIPFSDYPTYVAPVPGQRLQIVSFTNGVVTYYGDKQCLAYEGTYLLNHERIKPVRNRKVNSYIYRCVKRSETVHTFNLAKGTNQKQIIVPTQKKYSKYISIDSHSDESFFVSGHNIDGFILSSRYPAVLDKGCELTEVYSACLNGNYEVKLRIDRFRPCFLVGWHDKKKHWLISLFKADL